MTAQRDCLAAAAAMIADIPGPVLELGLGNGRTYDHLREILPEREIFVFDRRVAAHPDCVPDDDHMILGDITETLSRAGAVIGAKAAFAHCDMGTGVAASNAELADAIGPALAGLMAPGGVIVSDQEYRVAGWTEIALPDGIAPGRYFIRRAGTVPD